VFPVFPDRQPSNVTVDGDIVAGWNDQRLVAQQLQQDRLRSDLDDGSPVAGPFQVESDFGHHLWGRFEAAGARLAAESAGLRYDLGPVKALSPEAMTMCPKRLGMSGSPAKASRMAV
jgi:hypothetical protein